MISWTAVYVLWLREIKRFFRARSRVVGSLAMPLLFMGFLGLGFSRMPVPGMGGNIRYLPFIVPGIIGMSLLFSSTFSGLSVLWDREFGFLKEIMVAPVSRLSLVLGRVAGGSTAVLLQSTLILLISFLLGFKIPGALALFLTLLFMMFISFTFLGVGLIFASIMRDMQGFSIVMNFVIFPLFFLSGALYPLENLPIPVRYLSSIDPLTYGVDGLRSVLLGRSSFPWALDLVAITFFSVGMVSLGAYLFEKTETA